MRTCLAPADRRRGPPGHPNYETIALQGIDLEEKAVYVLYRPDAVNWSNIYRRFEHSSDLLDFQN